MDILSHLIQQIGIFVTFLALFHGFHLELLVSMARSGHFEPFYSGIDLFFDVGISNSRFHPPPFAPVPWEYLKVK